MFGELFIVTFLINLKTFYVKENVGLLMIRERRASYGRTDKQTQPSWLLEDKYANRRMFGA